MSIKMPITKEKIKNHFHYSWWMYALLAIIALFGWNLVYTSTRYRPPEDKKVQFYADGFLDSQQYDDINAYMQVIKAEILPDMEEVSCTVVGYDETYGNMQLMVWAAAGEGDVYLLSKERFDYISSDGAMMALQDRIDDGTLHVDGIDLANGYARDTETGAKTLCGIPADTLTGLNQYGFASKDMVLCVLAYGQNDENSLKFLDYLLTHLRAPDATDAAAAAPTEAPLAEAAPTTAPTEAPLAEVAQP